MELGTGRIVWAVDIFEPEENHKKALSVLKSFASKTNSEIEIVHVLNFAYTPPVPSNVPSWEESLQALAQNRMDELVKSSEISKVKTKILSIPNESSTRKNVDILVDHLKSVKAATVLVSTHARRGVSRFFLGSFAETLLLQSPVPVLTLNPDTHTVDKISHILFPTYFTPASHNAFQTVITLAKSLGAQLTLYYKEPMLLTGTFAMPISMHEYMSKELDTRRKIAARWREQAEELGVPTNLSLDETPGNAGYAISEYAADKDVDLITMMTFSDPMSSVMIGSATRQVVRQAQCPILVMRSSQ